MRHLMILPFRAVLEPRALCSVSFLLTVFMLWAQFEIRFQETVSFQNPISTFGLLCFVKTTRTNKQKTEQKPHQKIFFQGTKSFGLDRIIDIWILLQPEEERKKREYPAGHRAVDGSPAVTRDGIGRACSQRSYLPSGRGWSWCLLFHQDWDAQGLLSQRNR